MWSAGPNAAYAVADNGRVNFNDGLGWTQIEPTESVHLADLKCIWGFGPADVFIAGYRSYSIDPGTGLDLFRWNGVGWAEPGSFESWYPIALWGSSANDLYFATDHVLVRYDGTGFEVVLKTVP